MLKSSYRGRGGGQGGGKRTSRVSEKGEGAKRTRQQLAFLHKSVRTLGEGSSRARCPFTIQKGFR
jgi:hypothetical protein